MTENEHTTPSAIDDMLADLGPAQVGDERLLSTLTDLRAQAKDVPVASPEVVALLQGATPLRANSRQRLVFAAAAGALAFGGASAAAATNNLPDPLQEVVAKVTGAPHPDEHAGPKPVKPTNAPDDAPGQLKDKADHPNNGSNAQGANSGHDNSDAPGQIQKATKPDPSDDGPAKPADPGSHGRARAADVQASHERGDNKKDSTHNAHAKKPKKFDHAKGRDNDKGTKGGNGH